MSFYLNFVCLIQRKFFVINYEIYKKFLKELFLHHIFNTNFSDHVKRCYNKIDTSDNIITFIEI